MNANFYAGTLDAANFTTLPLDLLKAWQRLSKDAERLGCTLVVFRVPTVGINQIIAKTERLLQDTYPDQIIDAQKGNDTI